jgi:hypothetical protein
MRNQGKENLGKAVIDQQDKKLRVPEDAETLVHYEREIREKGETEWLKSTRNG